MPFTIIFLVTVLAGIRTGSFFFHSNVGMKLILVCFPFFCSLKLGMSAYVKHLNLCYVFSIFIIILLKLCNKFSRGQGTGRRRGVRQTS
jgi:hypothetical protein